jgi:hypothetical protein
MTIDNTPRSVIPNHMADSRITNRTSYVAIRCNYNITDTDDLTALNRVPSSGV